jgi:signal transduction histidine kinase/CheY-like chemotaxis protein/HPt (histidine-containing phosphotransfer) domain-containing protein
LNWLPALPTILPLVVAGAVGLALAIAAWPRRDLPGARIAILNAAAVGLFWCGALVAQLLSEGLAAKLLWQKVRFLGAAIMPAAFLLQVLTCTGRRAWITRGRVALLAAVPVLATLAAWTSEWHTLAFHHLRLVAAGPLVQLGHETGLALRGYVAFAVACLAVAAVLLLDAIATGGPRYRAQAAVLLAAAAIPWLSRLLPGAAPGLVLSAGVHPLGLVVSAMVAWVAVFRLGLFDLVPIARGTVIEGMADALVVLDRRGRIVDLNPAARRELGGAAVNGVGLDARQALGGWPGWRELAPLVEGGATESAGGPVELRVGERVLEATCTPLVPGQGGTAEGRVLLLRDVTERTRERAELARARAEAEAASAAKSEFLARMSHELRTPVSGILGLCELLLEGPLEDAQRQRVAALRRSGRVLLTVLDDVLDAARLDAGRVELACETFEPRRVLGDVVALFAHDARAKGLALEAHVSDAVPGTVEGDATRVHQALANLVANAVKFTDEGRVVVAVDASARPGGSLLRFEVQDTGPGVPAEAHARLFQPFVQADPGAARRHGGAGLGLAICRQLATLMGGAAGFTSEAGRGSAFWFTARVGTGAAAAPVQGRGARFAGRVLVADDHPLNREVLRELLQRRGCRVDEAAGGREAIERATSGEPYDLVLLDLQMPELDGCAAAAAIRRREDGRLHTPLVALTASTLPEDRARALAAGMDEHLVKPLTGAALVAVLERFLAHAPDDRPAGGAPEGEPDAPLDADLLERFLEDARSSIERLRACLAEGDLERLRREAHRLRGGSLFLGAARLASLCDGLQPARAAADGAHALREMERELARLQDAPRVHR